MCRFSSAATLLLYAILLPGCTSGNGDPEEDPAVGDNRLACEALAPPGGGNGLIGFAAVEADGLRRTTGGAGGTVHAAHSLAELAGLLDNGANNDPKIIRISGTLTGSGAVEVGSNTTLVGVDNGAISGFGLTVADARNIIIANLDFSGGSGNAIRITEGSHHVWVHHNAFSTYDDNAIEIREGASYVTVAWNHFHNQNKVLLTGHSDENGGQDVGRLKVTYHHNWFDDTSQRHPLVRFGEAHVFNNFFDDVDLYGVASSMEAEVLVQANYFKNVMLPASRGPTATGTLDEGDLVECDNVYDDSGDPETRGAAFDPAVFYSYPLDEAETVPDVVMAGAGPDSQSPPDDDPEPTPDPTPEPPPAIDPPVIDPPEPPVVEPPPEEPPVDEPPGDDDGAGDGDDDSDDGPGGDDDLPGDDDGVPGGPDDEQDDGGTPGDDGGDEDEGGLVVVLRVPSVAPAGPA